MNTRRWEELLRVRRIQEQAAHGRLRSARTAAEEQRRRVEEARQELETYRLERERRTAALYEAILGRRLPPGDLSRVYQVVAGLREGEQNRRAILEEKENLWRRAIAAVEEARAGWQIAQCEWEAVKERAEELREEEAALTLRKEESESDEEGQTRTWTGHTGHSVGQAWDAEPAPEGGLEAGITNRE